MAATLKIVSDGTIAGTTLYAVEGQTETEITGVRGFSLARDGDDLVAEIRVARARLDLSNVEFARVDL